MWSEDNSRPPGPGRVVLEALPLGAALVALALWLAAEAPPTAPEARSLRPIQADSARALAAVFRRHEYRWPPGARIPALAVQTLPADLGEQPVARRKSLFFRSLLPLVLAENARIEAHRQRLIGILETGALTESAAARVFAEEIARRYGVGDGLDAPAARQRLLRRVDTVPPALVLAQAAIESGWGTSRFARQANSLFGARTWNPDGGLTPARRADGADHYVRAFPDLEASVRGYLHNLNTHPAYERLRRLRAEARAGGRQPEALRLAGGLLKYSTRGAAYVADVRAMIRHNGLRQAVAGAALVGL